MPINASGDPNQRIVDSFRASGGTVDGIFTGMPLLLLTATGARSGRRRTVPLTYLADGASWVVAAAAAGTTRNPAWYHNVLARPAVTVEVGDRILDAIARIATGTERERLFGRFAAAYPQLASYQVRTTRLIPMVVLSPAPPHSRVTPQAGQAGVVPLGRCSRPQVALGPDPRLAGTVRRHST
ncbi:nitroreductase/quinone reductase family protein [Actinoplanes subtropicus]|uniref:nitroreductase/quinone reductase family protein n=1 Tax=Actinoplanes subtropicus TaxID=543632 RepID=UPI0007C472D7|nr:nitroreductase/quinone reductase family protein [Actinoplanes subtropicus]